MCRLDSHYRLEPTGLINKLSITSLSILKGKNIDSRWTYGSQGSRIVHTTQQHYTHHKSCAHAMVVSSALWAHSSMDDSCVT